MSRERRLLVLASKPEGMSPSQRYRLEQWAPHLAAEHGIILDFAPFESAQLASLLYEPGQFLAKASLTLRDFVRRAAIVRTAQAYDAVVIHREAALIGPAIYERLIARTGKPIIFDFDDAIWSSQQPWINGLFSRLHFRKKTSTICRLASAVTTGNALLADYAQRRNPHVSIVPSSIELAEYPVLPEAEDKRFVVGWTGSTSTLAYFEHARAALERLASTIPVTVKIICSKPPVHPIAGAETQFIPWSAEREAADVADCHVGIMPLPDNEMSRGKGGMKALQFMATGRPVVVSPVGVNVDIVQDGGNGFLAESDVEWMDALTRLAADPEMRATLGRNARATVEEGFTAEKSAAKFAEVVRKVCR